MPVPLNAIFEGAKLVAGVFAGSAQRKAARATMRLNESRSRFAQGRDSAARLDQFLRERGSQRQAFAAGGLAGGLTRRLFEADTRARFQSGLEGAAAEFASGRSNARAQYRRGAAASRFGNLQAFASAGVDLLNTKPEGSTRTYGAQLYDRFVTSNIPRAAF